MARSTIYPHFRETVTGKQLIVNGRPFLILGGELQNSSLTSADYMDTVWQKMKDTNYNTLLGCVCWENIEPVEGKFKFDELDKVILGARKHGLHLILLWFGSFKNGEISLSLCVIQDLTEERYLNVHSDMGQDRCETFPSSQITQSRRHPRDK